jgi:NifU-like protein
MTDAAYPKKIMAIVDEKWASFDPNGHRGRAVNFDCGCFVDIAVGLESGDLVKNCTFQTNGCGYMYASAAIISDVLSGRSTDQLGGMERGEMFAAVTARIGASPPARIGCFDACFDAARSAFAEVRESRIAEYAGETALICTCFGIDEDRLTKLIRDNAVSDLDQLLDITPAGSGCGSCRMMMTELIETDVRERE